jgi:hypothetical protein
MKLNRPAVPPRKVTNVLEECHGPMRSQNSNRHFPKVHQFYLMEIINDIERAELLHKQLWGETTLASDDPVREKMNSQLLALLEHVQSMSSRELFFPGDIAERLDYLVSDAQSRSQTKVSTRVRNSTQLREYYALLKKHFATLSPQFSNVP